MTDGDCVWLPGHVAAFLSSMANEAMPEETGGVLLGYVSGESDQVVVSHAVGPGPSATHALDLFVPDYSYQEAEIARLYQQSGRQVSYLGDWHSHPRGDGTMSQADRETLRRIAACSSARSREPIMLILSGGPNWTPVAWRCRRLWRLQWLPGRLILPASVRVES